MGNLSYQAIKSHIYTITPARVGTCLHHKTLSLCKKQP